MRESQQSQSTSPAKSTHLGLFLARAPLGAWLVMAGFSKFAADGGVQGFVNRFAKILPAWIPQPVGNGFLTAVPYVELLAGAALVLGVAGRIGGLVAAMLLGAMMLAITGIHATNMPFSPNAVLLGVALLIVLAGPGAISMDQFMWRRSESDTFRGFAGKR